MSARATIVIDFPVAMPTPGSVTLTNEDVDYIKGLATAVADSLRGQVLTVRLEPSPGSTPSPTSMAFVEYGYGVKPPPIEPTDGLPDMEVTTAVELPEGCRKPALCQQLMDRHGMLPRICGPQICKAGHDGPRPKGGS